MGFRNLLDPNLVRVPGYSEFLNLDFTSLRPSQPSASGDGEKSKVQKLLEVFRDSIR